MVCEIMIETLYRFGQAANLRNEDMAPLRSREIRVQEIDTATHEVSGGVFILQRIAPMQEDIGQPSLDRVQSLTDVPCLFLKHSA